jgi:hypothetical protein
LAKEEQLRRNSIGIFRAIPYSMSVDLKKVKGSQFSVQNEK